MPETRARRRIRLAVESRGYTLTSLAWEPWGMAAEKEGVPGGWYGTLDRPTSAHDLTPGEIMGLSVEETLAWIDEFVPPPEGCGCTADHSPMLAASAMGDPETGLHEPSCRWRIAYRLPWWTSDAEVHDAG